VNENPFPAPMPVRVLLRNKQLALVEALVQDRPPFALLGHLQPYGSPGHIVDPVHPQDHQLWRFDGRWQEHGQSHPLDIIGVITQQTGDVLSVEVFAPAAGYKGEAAP
jgi:hypothetical protein